MVGRVILLTAVWMGLVLPACEEGAAEGPGPSTSTSTPAASASSEPEGLVVERIQVSSLDELVAAAAERGADLVLSLPDAEPTEVHFWESEGHLHVRSEYIDPDGEEIVIVQAMFGEDDYLTQGEAVRIRGHRGVEAGQHWYWRERGWVIATAADPAIAKRLRWLDTS